MLFFERNSSFPQYITSKSSTITHGGFDSWLSSSKTLIFKNGSTNLPSDRKVKTFSIWLETTYKRSKCLVLSSLVEGFKIPLLQEPKQIFSRKPQQWNKDQKELIDLGVKEMLEKVSHLEGEFLYQIFLVGKKDGINRLVISLKTLTKFVIYQHFKMEGLHWLTFSLQSGDYMWKIDLKDAYFSVR